MTKSLIVKSDAGVFKLEQTGYREYFAEANGITLTVKKNSVSVKRGKNDHFFFFDGGLSKSLNYISDSIDSMFPGILDDNKDDVRYLKTSRGRLAYYAYNTNLDGTPVIFLHGGPGGESNTKKARKLRLNHPIYLYDQMGSGRSAKIKDFSEWDENAYAEELKEFISLMKFKKVILVGASWGAGLAALYAIKTGCRKIESMVLVSPFFSSKQWEEDQFNNLKQLDEKYQNAIFDYLQGKGSRKKYLSAMEIYNSKFLFSQKKNLDVAIEATNEPLNKVYKAMVGDNEFVTTGKMKNFDIVKKLNKIKVPVLMMNGDSDEVRIETAKSYSEKIENCKLAIVKNAGHALSFEQFDDYRKNILKFLD